MKKILLTLSIIGTATLSWADTKVSALTADTTAQTTDLLYKVDTVGSNVSRSITVGNFASGVAFSSFNVVNPNPGSFGNTTQTSSITVNAQGRITGVANVTITPAASSITAGSLPATVIASSGTPLNLFAGTSRLPTANMTFFHELDPIRCKLLSPGTTNFPAIDNSTTTAIQSAYWNQVTTQTISWSFQLRPYSGGNLFESFQFAGSTVTSGNVQWTTYLTCNKSVDSQLQSYALDVSTAGAVPGTANVRTVIENGPLTLNGCVEGDIITVLVTRNHNIASEAVGDIRLFPGMIYEK